MSLVDVENDDVVSAVCCGKRERERERNPVQKKTHVVCMIPVVWMTRVAFWEMSGICAISRCGRGGMSVYCGRTKKPVFLLA